VLTIRQDDLASDPVRALLQMHLAGMHAYTPAGQVHALDLSALQAPEVTVWTAWIDDSLAGIGALKMLKGCGGELKSMRTHPDHLRKGVASAVLEHIIGAARARGLRRLSLETGTGPAFEPALALYRKRGFIEGEPFGDYESSTFNRMFHLTL